jgi:hypothetical protein
MMPGFVRTLAAVATATALGFAAPVSADPLERYTELQEVIEAVNDPDPLMRLALIEDIIAKGDATEVQLAIRAAFTIDDPNVRSLALRAHFASFRTLLITADWPEEIKKMVDAGERDQAAKRYSNNFIMMDTLGGVFSYRTEYAPGDTEFTVQSLNMIGDGREQNTGFGNIKGSVITLQSGTHIQYTHTVENCKFEFTDYIGFTVKGVGSCDVDDSLAFPVTLHLFEPEPKS